MRVELSELSKILSDFPDEQAAIDFRAKFICEARKELRDQQTRAKIDAIEAREAPPTPVRSMPERKGGTRFTRLQAAAHVGHCPTDFSAFVQMEMVRPDNPDAPSGSKHEYSLGALNNLLELYTKTERTRRLAEFKKARKAEKAAVAECQEAELFPHIGNI